MKLISHIGWAGELLPPGRLVDADKEMADDLISRGRAALATEEDKVQAEAAGLVPTAGGPWKQPA